MARSFGMHEDHGSGEVLGQPTSTTTVVEVDVGHDDVGQVVPAHPLLFEGGDHPVEARFGTRFDERGPWAGEEVARQLMLLVVHQRIDRLHQPGCCHTPKVSLPQRFPLAAEFLERRGT